MGPQKWVEVEPGIYQKSTEVDDPKNRHTLQAEDWNGLLVVVDSVLPEHSRLLDAPADSVLPDRWRLLDIPADSVALIEQERIVQRKGPVQLLIADQAYFAMFRIGQHVREAKAIEILIKTTFFPVDFFSRSSDEKDGFFEINGALARLSPEGPVLCTGPNPKPLKVLDNLSKNPFYGSMTTVPPSFLELSGASEYFTRFVVPAGFKGHIYLQHGSGIIDDIVSSGAYLLFRPAGRWSTAIIDNIPSSIAVEVTRSDNRFGSTYWAILKFDIKKPAIYLSTHGSSALSPVRLFTPRLVGSVEFPYWKPETDLERKINLEKLQSTLNIDYISLTSLEIVLYDSDKKIEELLPADAPQPAEESQ